MMNFQIEDWTPLSQPPARGVLRLRYAAAISMVAFFICAIVGLFLSSAAVLPFLIVSMICWIVFGSASRKNRYANPGKYRLVR